MTYDIHSEQPVITGMWKFADTVPEYQLIAVARGWSMGVNGDRYIDLHIRQCSKDQRAIGFKFHYDGTKKRYKKFFHAMTHQLKFMFGEGFVGWDVSSSTIIVK